MARMYVVMMTGICVLASSGFLAAETATFDDLTLSAESYWNGSDGSGGFTSGSATFNNSYTDWGDGYYSWGGFAYSNRSDNQTAGYDGQYTAVAGAAQSGGNYGIGFCDYWTPTIPTITFPAETQVQNLYVTNNNTTYYTLLNGDPVFGLDAFKAGDWFELTITGKNSSGEGTGSVIVPLADFRDGKNEILNTWQWVDTSGLGAVKSLEFTLASSDTGDFGMNTPAYFAVDTVVAVPEPAMLLSFLAGIGCYLSKKQKNSANNN